MQAEHLKRWLEEVRKDETVAAKLAATEGTTSVLEGKGGWETEDRREKTPV